MLIKPQVLKRGDKVGIISPSWCGAGLFPHRLKRGISFLRTLGLNITLGSCTSLIKNATTGTPKERANDINRMFADQEIKAIFTTIGGVYCNEVLPYINFELVRKNPKIFVGYSDISSLLLAFYAQTNLVTFNGPMVITQMAEYPKIFDYTIKYFKKAIFSPLPIGRIKPSLWWTDEQLEWRQMEDLTRPRKLKKGNWKWLKKGKAKGKLMGGCLNTLLRLKGTKFLPDFNNTLFFWEIPEGVKPEYLDLMLSDLELLGIFPKISGMIAGRPSQYSKENLQIFEKILLNRTKQYNFPILVHVEIGHADPILTIPIGINTELNSSSNTFTIKESGVIE